MIKSMTGYGKAEFETGNKKITIELKSLNSKQLDINSRMPMLYREKDLVIRKEISEKLIRGKVDFSLYLENLGTESNSAINANIVSAYFNQLSDIQQKLGLPVTEQIMQNIMRLPDTVKTVYEELNENEWLEIFVHIKKVIATLDEFRVQEGKALDKDIRSNITDIQQLLTQIETFETQRIENVKTRILDGLNEIALNGNMDKNRFEQELIYYLEKLDINEEKVRLTNHCTYFLETLESPKDVGKKLGFIAQEIGREINTIGSKANESNIQRIVVQMKDALERIKEQLLNVL
ncbi:YicC/YloC family endoribonuclease [Mangrovibacterium lignilyticum]|uniref:YicC/YloC family endoribonuclease n=1 Tax=Mangrovibacterium lignilyticum TaxID=2668052 RepID=UPI0013D872FF|nr:YicC/YloC family endoribonuclease [Mangrovibacterium lignilyticum]